MMAVKFELPEDIEHHLEKQWGKTCDHGCVTSHDDSRQARLSWLGAPGFKEFRCKTQLPAARW